MKQLVEAAIDMHSRKIFHRDLKLENILIQTTSEGPRVRIIDFGCGAVVGNDPYHSFAGTVLLLLFIHLLISGVISRTSQPVPHPLSPYVLHTGTFEFAPPEFYLTQSYEALPTTVWQLGTLLFDLVDRNKPFDTRAFIRSEIKISNKLSKGNVPVAVCCIISVQCSVPSMSR